MGYIPPKNGGCGFPWYPVLTHLLATVPCTLTLLDRCFVPTPPFTPFAEANGGLLGGCERLRLHPIIFHGWINYYTIHLQKSGQNIQKSHPQRLRAFPMPTYNIQKQQPKTPSAARWIIPGRMVQWLITMVIIFVPLRNRVVKTPFPKMAYIFMA